MNWIPKPSDKLYCHTTLVMDDDNEITLIAGNYYYISHIQNDEDIVLCNEQRYMHYFNFVDKNSHSYYGNWLTEKREQRRKKLEKILENE